MASADENGKAATPNDWKGKAKAIKDIIWITPPSVEKGDSPSGLAANALSARLINITFLIDFFQLGRELVRAA